MVRTVGLHLLHRGILRFSTSSHPEALGARYSALWRLPQSDSHRQVDGDFKAHQPVVLDDLGYVSSIKTYFII